MRPFFDEHGMPEVISLRKARKSAERDKRAQEAQANRVLHGLTKAERQLHQARADKARRDLEQRRIGERDEG